MMSFSLVVLVDFMEGGNVREIEVQKVFGVLLRQRFLRIIDFFGILIIGLFFGFCL